MIKIGAVSYLNTKPLIYGMNQGLLKNTASLQIDYPASIAQKLIDNEIDIGLIPVATIPNLSEYLIVTNYCIGCNGDVASVCLFSDVPLTEIKTILLDYQSKTSVALLKILIKEYWKLDVEFIEGSNGYENDIKSTVAGLVIGDRAFEQKKKSLYSYDLGGAWKEMTGLPFVFAAWVANKKIEEVFIHEFNKANAVGLSKINEVIALNENAIVDLDYYYKHNLDYNLDAEKRKAMELFLSKI